MLGDSDPLALVQGQLVKQSCWGGIRTHDLRVMSPTSCHCSTQPANYSQRFRGLRLALAVAAAALGLEVSLQVRKPLLARFKELGKLLLESWIRPVGQRLLSPAPPPANRHLRRRLQRLLQ